MGTVSNHISIRHQIRLTYNYKEKLPTTKRAMRTGAILVAAECANTVMHGGLAGVTIAANLMTLGVNVLLIKKKSTNRHKPRPQHYCSSSFNIVFIKFISCFFQSRFV